MQIEKMCCSGCHHPLQKVPLNLVYVSCSWTIGWHALNDAAVEFVWQLNMLQFLEFAVFDFLIMEAVLMLHNRFSVEFQEKECEENVKILEFVIKKNKNSKLFLWRKRTKKLLFLYIQFFYCCFRRLCTDLWVKEK